MRFENNLRLLRLNKLASQEEVASAIHVSRSTYAKYERGTRRPDLDTLARLAEYFNVRVDFLLQLETGRFINELNMYAAMIDQQQILVDIFQSLSVYSQGKLIERAEVIKEDDERMLDVSHGITAGSPYEPSPLPDDTVCKEFLIEHGLYDEDTYEVI